MIKSLVLLIPLVAFGYDGSKKGSTFVHTDFKKCGVYEVRGYVRLEGDAPTLVIHEGSASLLFLKIEGVKVESARSSVGQFVSITGLMLKKPVERHGQIIVDKILMAVADPLDTNGGQGLRFISQKPCR